MIKVTSRSKNSIRTCLVDIDVSPLELLYELDSLIGALLREYDPDIINAVINNNLDELTTSIEKSNRYKLNLFLEILKGGKEKIGKDNLSDKSD